MLEKDFSDRVTHEPELLAHHYTKAGVHGRAVAYWLAAAQTASARFSNPEAVGHAQKGLELLPALPQGDERDQHELLLQITLGWALASAKGYGAAEVWPSLSSAHELCNRMGQTARMGSILFGLWVSYLMRGRYQAGTETARQVLELGQQLENTGIIVAGHQSIACLGIFTGDFRSALEHAEAGLADYDVREHAALARELGGLDNGPLCADWCAWAYWLLGYPDRSNQSGRQALEMARQAGLPFTTATILVHSAVIGYFRSSPETVLEHARAAIAVCDQVGIPFRKAESQILEGWALTDLGEAETGILELDAGLSAWMQMGTEIANSIWFALLALVYRRLGRVSDARGQLSRAFESVEKNGELVWKAELHRLDGLLRLQAGEPMGEVEACFRKAIEVAKSQSAKSLELRACTSLAELWQAKGQRQQARDLLAPIYNWFTEGFDTHDLKSARELLESLR